MAELYLWVTPEDYPQKLFGRYIREGSPDRFLFRHGVKLPSKLIAKYNRQKLMVDKKKPTLQDSTGKTRGFYLYRYENDVYVLVVHSESDAEVLNLSHLIQAKNDDNAEKEIPTLHWPRIENDQKASASIGPILRDFIISNCKYIQPSVKPIIKFSVPKQKLLFYDCLRSDIGSLPLINKRITEILTELASNDVQFFDTDIECSDGKLEGYKLLNITHTIKGIDREHSIYKLGPEDSAMKGDFLFFKYLTYKLGCMGKYKLARDAEYLGHLLITKEVKKAFEHEKISGVRLVRPEDYYPVF